MKKILVSGLINTETTVRVKEFPIEYFPIDFPFFGVNTRVSGVAYNLAKAFRSLGDDVRLVTMTGQDFSADYIKAEVEKIGVDTGYIKGILEATSNSISTPRSAKILLMADFTFAAVPTGTVDLVTRIAYLFKLRANVSATAMTY